MTTTIKHIYQITIYTPSQPTYLFKQHINKQYLEEASSKQQIINNIHFQNILTYLKTQYPYTHYTIEGL